MRVSIGMEVRDNDRVKNLPVSAVKSTRTGMKENGSKR